MCWLPQFPCLFHILKLGCLNWQMPFQKLPFSINDQIFTKPPPPFLTFFIFNITSCAFEAVVTPFLHKYNCSLQHWPLVHSSICLIFSIESISNFPRNSSTRVLVLVASTSVSSGQSVIISQTKSILGFTTAVKSILLQFLQELTQVTFQPLRIVCSHFTDYIF